MKDINRFKSILIASLAIVILPKAAFGFGISAKGKLMTYGQGVHESITLRALEDIQFFEGVDKKKLKFEVKNVLEGVRFNDDPEGFFMDKDVIGFVGKFLDDNGYKAKKDPTKSSHFGHYQFLHAMGSRSLTREDIKGKMDRYIYHCWRMITDENSFENFKRDYEIVTQHLKREKEYQNSNIGFPPEYISFRYTRDQLIIRESVELFPKNVLFFHAKNQTEFKNRALGSLLHVIQDSYALGHVVRVGWEEGDNSGKIRYFQNYSEQDSGKHKDFDTLPGGDLSGNNFLKIPGSQAALDRSVQVLQMIKNRCPWTRNYDEVNLNCSDSVYGLVSKDIFAFDENNIDIDISTHSHPELKIGEVLNFDWRLENR